MFTKKKNEEYGKFIFVKNEIILMCIPLQK